MIISTKGRYGLRVMLDLAQHKEGEFISLKSIAERQEISMKYLEGIVAALNKAGLVASQRGKDGGYRLTRPADDYTVGEIVRATEGGLAPVACPDCEEGGSGCGRSETCLTLPIWRRLDLIINGYLDGISLTDALNGSDLPDMESLLNQAGGGERA